MTRVWPELLMVVMLLLWIAALSFALGVTVSERRSESKPITCEIVGGWIICDGEPVTQIVHKDGECEQ